MCGIEDCRCYRNFINAAERLRETGLSEDETQLAFAVAGACLECIRRNYRQRQNGMKIESLTDEDLII